MLGQDMLVNSRPSRQPLRCFDHIDRLFNWGFPLSLAQLPNALEADWDCSLVWRDGARVLRPNEGRGTVPDAVRGRIGVVETGVLEIANGIKRRNNQFWDERSEFSQIVGRTQSLVLMAKASWWFWSRIGKIVYG